VITREHHQRETGLHCVISSGANVIGHQVEGSNSNGTRSSPESIYMLIQCCLDKQLVALGAVTSFRMT
jgi:hypothetical protein